MSFHWRTHTQTELGIPFLLSILSIIITMCSFLWKTFSSSCSDEKKESKRGCDKNPPIRKLAKTSHTYMPEGEPGFPFWRETYTYGAQRSLFFFLLDTKWNLKHYCEVKVYTWEYKRHEFLYLLIFGTKMNGGSTGVTKVPFPQSLELISILGLELVLYAGYLKVSRVFITSNAIEFNFRTLVMQELRSMPNFRVQW